MEPQFTDMADKDTKTNIIVSNVPVLYTDTIFMNVNEDGVVIDVAQKTPPNNLAIVTRIGMSREHAKKFVKKLSEILALTSAHTHTTEKEKKN